MHPFALKNELLYGLLRKIYCCCTKSVPYGFINSVGCLEIRALTLPWKSCHFSAANPSSENGKLLLLLSLNVSRKMFLLYKTPLPNLMNRKVPEDNMQSRNTKKLRKNREHNDTIDSKNDTFIISIAKFTCLFEGATSSRAELKYKMIHKTKFSMLSTPIYTISIF
jgi:hypothetical protein